MPGVDNQGGFVRVCSSVFGNRVKQCLGQKLLTLLLLRIGTQTRFMCICINTLDNTCDNSGGICYGAGERGRLHERARDLYRSNDLRAVFSCRR